MNTQMCIVKIGEESRQYPVGTSYATIAGDFQQQFRYPIVLTCVNERCLQELNKTVQEDCRLSFLTTADKYGYEAYRRSLCFLMIKAVHDVGMHEQIQKVRVHFSISKGYYCTIEGSALLNESLLKKITNRMLELAEQKIPFEKRTLPTEEAIRLFERHGMYDKKRLFEYRKASWVNIYRLNEFEDYYYGYMLPDTRYLNYFSLHLYKDGFVLQMPERKNPEIIPPFEPSAKLFDVLKKSVAWGDMQNIETVGALNEMITTQDMREVVLVQEAHQEREIAQIADKIAANPEIKFVLIAGPSSSGKTTFSHRLSIQLRANGKTPHPIEVDNYFLNREDSPKDEDGNYNFEGLDAVDIAQFNKDMQALLKGELVYLPIYNFKTGRREWSIKPKQLGEHDILVIEGIHCLNPKLTEMLSDKNKFKIYISALTQLNIDEHNRIPSTDGRLIRRIVRDARTRNTSATQTIRMWKTVRKGEENNIFPYQDEADVMFNSSLLYELSVLKQYVEPLLYGVDKTSPEYAEAKRLLKFFDYFVGIGNDIVPSNSLLREFIGGSCF